MAHFAKLDDSNLVTEVVVVHNNEAPDEAAGIAFLTSLFGPARWKQTSYSGSMRKQFSGIGFSYDEAADVFIAPQPWLSWTLNADHDWHPTELLRDPSATPGRSISESVARKIAALAETSGGQVAGPS